MVDKNGQEYFLPLNQNKSVVQPQRTPPSNQPVLKKKEGAKIQSFSNQPFIDPASKTVNAVLYNGSYFFQIPQNNSFLVNKEIEYEDVDQLLKTQQDKISQLKTNLENRPTGEAQKYGAMIEGIVTQI